MQEERMRNLEEGRPYVVIDSTTVELEDPVNGYEEYQEDLFYAYKRHWTYYHHFENIGTRPAIQLTITNKVLEMDYKKWEEDYSTCKLIINDSFVLSNPLTQQFQLPRHTSIGFKKHKKYLIKTSLQYKDKLTDSLYYDNYYYSNAYLFFSELNFEYFPDKLDHADNITSALTDSLLHVVMTNLQLATEAKSYIPFPYRSNPLVLIPTYNWSIKPDLPVKVSRKPPVLQS